ncbi:MAG: T9SS type A sorting domain-containing protein [Saprospiraceae bacterium]|nr:T9SS type A sorting domain-containing protein [Saprospiraceae bacterium]
MKYLTVQLMLCFIMNCFVQAQSWSVIHNFIPQQTLHKVRFRNSEFGISVGTLYNSSTKNIHRTIDGGRTWTDISSGYTATRFMDIFFLSDSVVYMSGNEGLILRSYNGGLNWETLNTGTKEQLWGVHFTSPKIGFAVGSNGKIIYTNNGGNTWEDRSTGKNNLLYDVTFTPGGTGFASGSNILLRSDDSGQSWFEVVNFPFERPADWIRSIHFVNDQLGFACADIGRIYRTKDGGENWERLNSPTQEPLFEVDFINENLGIIVGFSGTILHTNDSGNNWSVVESPLGQEHNYSADFIDNNHAFICTHFGSILSMNNLIQVKDLDNHPFEYSIFPNPVSDRLYIRFKDLNTHRVSIYSSGGKQLLQQNILKSDAIVLKEFSPGSYHFVVSDENSNRLHSRLFIKH